MNELPPALRIPRSAIAFGALVVACVIAEIVLISHGLDGTWVYTVVFFVSQIALAAEFFVIGRYAEASRRWRESLRQS